MLVLFKRLYGKRAVALAAAGAVALGVGMAATPNEAAAQCTIQDTTGATTDIDTASELDNPTGLASVDGTDTITVNCDGSIDSDSIVNGSVTGADIGSETITGANIDDGTIGVDDLGTNSVGSDEVIDNSLTSDDLAADSVTDSELADDAVDTAAIQDGAVTTAKIADDAVTWDKLAPGVRNRIDENTEGVAIALALQNPDLVGNESFGLSVNWGGFDNANALGVAATGVLGRDVFGAGDRLSIAGGVGIGMDDDTVGGRVGAQLSW